MTPEDRAPHLARRQDMLVLLAIGLLLLAIAYWTCG